MEKLNDTVFSKTFRAPSAWAEREVKYKMEKKAWDTEVSSRSSWARGHYLLKTHKTCIALLCCLCLLPSPDNCLHGNVQCSTLHRYMQVLKSLSGENRIHHKCCKTSIVHVQVDRLQGIISKLQAENVEYRDNSKTEQFEDKILELQQKLHQTGLQNCSISPLRPLLLSLAY